MKTYQIVKQFFMAALAVLSCVSVLAQDVITYYHTDVAGSPIAATDASGALVWREDYSPYGERLQKQSAASGDHQWFTGHHHDEQSGLTYAGARHYDPLLGRFMGVDPAAMDPANQFTFNRYAYANNNPYAFADPNGAEVGAAYRAIFLADGGRNQKINPADRTLPTQPIEYFIGGGLALMALPVVTVGGYELGLLALANPASTSAWTIAAAEAAAGGAVVGHTQVVARASLHIIEETHEVIHFTASTSRGAVEVISNIAAEGQTLRLFKLHAEGVGIKAGELGRIGINEVKQALMELGKSRGFKKVIIEGGERSTGKMKGRTPTPIEINVE